MAVSKKDEERLLTARQQFDNAAENSRPWRKRTDESLDFLTGKQWPDLNRAARASQTRPVLTMNRLTQFVRLVANEINRSRPGMRVLPVDSAADVRTAEVLYGIIKHIERNADASTAYGMATDYQVRCGLGYFGFKTRYSSRNSFSQEIELRAFPNPLAVFQDPSSVEFDGSDSRFYFVVEKMAREAYKEQYPDSEANKEGFMSYATDATWMSKDEVSVAEYWYTENKTKTLYRLRSGQVGFREDFGHHDEKKFRPMIADEREVEDRIVKRLMINGYEILEDEEWPGSWIPIIPVYGDFLIVKGKPYICGLIEYGKEPQQLLNYIVSCFTEILANAPRSPWVAAVGQIKTFKKQWDEANINPPTVLQYDPVTATTADGRELVAPPPKRNDAAPQIQPFVQAMIVAEEGIRNAVGLHGPSIGKLSSERSGKAIAKLQEQGNITTYHYVLNFARSIRFAVKQLVGDGNFEGLIQKIYNEPGRILRIIGADETEQMMAVGKDDKKIPAAVKQSDDYAGVFDIGVGLYDVAVDIGQAFSTQRKEAFEAMGQIFQSQPELFKMFGDLWVKYADFEGATEMAKRFRKILPPEISGEEPVIPDELKQQMGQMKQQLQQAMEELEKKDKIILSKEIEAGSKERIAELETNAEVRFKLVDAQLKAAAILAEVMEKQEQRASNEMMDEFKQLMSLAQQKIKEAEKPAPGAPAPKPTTPAPAGVPAGVPAGRPTGPV